MWICRLLLTWANKTRQIKDIPKKLKTIKHAWLLCLNYYTVGKLSFNWLIIINMLFCKWGDQLNFQNDISCITLDLVKALTVLCPLRWQLVTWKHLCIKGTPWKEVRVRWEIMIKFCHVTMFSPSSVRTVHLIQPFQVHQMYGTCW